MTNSRKEFKLAISDAEELINCYDDYNKNDKNSKSLEVLKRASLIMVLTAWETYIEDVVSEIIDKKYSMVKGSMLGNVIDKRLFEYLKTFNNPDSRKTKAIFQEFFAIDITECWTWGNYHTPKDSNTILNMWLKKRGEAVHRSCIDKNSSHIVKRDELDKCVRFFKEIVEVTDKYLVDL